MHKGGTKELYKATTPIAKDGAGTDDEDEEGEAAGEGREGGTNGKSMQGGMASKSMQGGGKASRSTQRKDDRKPVAHNVAANQHTQAKEAHWSNQKHKEPERVDKDFEKHQAKRWRSGPQ